MDRQKYYGGESASITPLTDVSCWGCQKGGGEWGDRRQGVWEVGESRKLGVEGGWRWEGG